jgi:hypothetical protein
MRRRQRWGVKPLGQCNLTRKSGCQIARGRSDCQYQGGQVLGLNGMVNICESLINTVSTNKPKILIGLSQKGMWSGADATKSSAADEVPPVKRRDLTHSGTHTEQGKPTSLPADSHRPGKASRKVSPWRCG